MFIPGSNGSSSEAPILIGRSPAIDALRAEIATAGRTHAKVLLLGETGVGKEVVARLIHARSRRAVRPFVAVNCSGIPETLLESELFGHMRGSFTGAYRDKVGLVRQAAGGTLFLDELGEMSLRMQAVLLRFTETGEMQPVGANIPAARVDARLVTATNRDLRAQVAAGAFREDLYYRLNVIEIRVPPLRARGEDILLLFQHYFDRIAHAHGVCPPELTADAAQILLAYMWPGNVRELRNVAERLLLRDRGRPLMPEDLPPEIRGAQSVATAIAPSAGADMAGSPAATPDDITADRVRQLWDRMQAGEDFWIVVHQAFRARQLTRDDLVALIDRGLRETRGSYRALLKIFHLAPAHYKRFHAFLYQQRCNLPVAPYRNLRVPTSRVGSARH